MRKVLPRIINFITYIVAIFAFLPNAVIVTIFNKVDNLLKLSGNLSSKVLIFVCGNTWYSFKIIYLPLIIVLISVLFLVSATIDRNIKKHNKEASIALDLNTYYPLYFLGIFNCFSGLIHSIFNCLNKTFESFKLLDTDYYYLGYFINKRIGKTFEVSFIFEIIFYVVLLIIFFTLYLKAFKKNYKKSFIIRFLSWMLVFILTFISMKGYFAYNYFSPSIGFKDLLMFKFNAPIAYLFSNITLKEGYLFMYVTLGLFALYVIIGIIRIIINNKLINNKDLLSDDNDDEIFKPVNNVPSFEDLTKDIKNIKTETNSLPVENDINNNIYNTKQTEEIIETVVEEKTVIKQVLFEESNLDKIFATTFNFTNTKMVINNGNQDYYVNKIKFLTLLNNNRAMSFRLDLDKAIKLIIQYPLILKDKYEDHKIWFKIEDVSKLSNDIIVSIIKDAYNAVLNDD